MFSLLLRPKYLFGHLPQTLLASSQQLYYLIKSKSVQSENLCKKLEQTNSSFIEHKKRIIKGAYKQQKLPSAIQRKPNNKIKMKTVPSYITLQILGNGSNGAPQVVFLFTDQCRYLFNCGEGAQRLANEHKTKLSRLQAVFLTRNNWRICGGLPGLSLTLREVDVEEMDVLGPPFLSEMIHKMEQFASIKTYHTLNIVDTIENNIYEDNTMVVQTILLNKSRSNINDDISNNLNKGELLGNINKFSKIGNKKIDKTTNEQKEEERNFHSNNDYNNENYDDSDCTVASYVCYLKSKPGSLMAEKCAELHVPIGPLLGKLKNGIDVVLENGTVVHSKDVCSENEPCFKILFLDIPNEKFLPSLLSSEKLYQKSWIDIQSNENKNKFQSKDEIKTEIAVIIHFTPQNIIEHPDYQKFCHRIASSTTKHIYVNGGENKLFSGFLASQTQQYQLNQLNPKIFPLLNESHEILALKEKQDKLIESENSSKDIDKTNEMNNESNIVPLGTLTHYHLRGKKGIDRSFEVTVDPQNNLNLCENLNFITQRDCLRNLYKKLNEQTGIDYTSSELIDNCVNKGKYPIITFLGTGSCLPNKLRNVSAILMQTSDDCYILLDCGEGTFGQMIRLFGLQRTRKIIENLKIIYISHQHADHHLGLFNILIEKMKIHQYLKQNNTNEDVKSNFRRILLLAPIQLKSWLNYYNNYVNNIDPFYTFISNAHFLSNSMELNTKNYFDNEIIPSIKSVSTCLVKHSVHSFGVSFLLNIENRSEPIKITYSGDTMPCRDLVELGKNSTVLIHEATMEDELFEEAAFKTHSTISQAMEQGQAMNAKYIILTHFSQRYSKLPRLHYADKDGKILDKMRNVSIAFDNMQIRLEDLDHFYLLYPSLWALFADDIDVLEQRAIKREQSRQRKRRYSVEDLDQNCVYKH